MTKNSLAIYCHIPFCETICGYCDFCKVPLNLQTEKGVFRLKKFEELVLRELELRKGVIAGKTISSVFFGGGTPSLANADFFQSFLEKVEELSLGLSENCEITVEANPDSLVRGENSQSENCLENLVSLMRAGINRLSIGVQSFDTEVLKTLERFHTPENVELVAKTAKEIGLNFSVDLIYGAPRESLDSWKKTVEKAVSLKPNHISCYALTLEPGVRMSRKIKEEKMEKVDEDLQAQMYFEANSILLEAGFEWYETSNWARGFENRSAHNLTYWNCGNWLGVGPSAHSHLCSGSAQTRFWNFDSVATWESALEENRLAESGSEKLDEDEKKLERAIMAARLREPVLAEIWGEGAIENLVEKGLLDAKSNLLTVEGRLLGDEVTRILDAAEVKNLVCKHYQKSTCRSCPQCIVE